MQIFIYLLSGLLVLVCLLLVLAVLMQLPRNEGLGTAFGGGMTENLFGAETTNVLTKATVWLGIIFFILTLTLSVVYSYHHKQRGSSIERELLASPAVTAPAVRRPPIFPIGMTFFGLFTQQSSDYLLYILRNAFIIV